ncbi:MAG: UDP-N-acetylmuramoyl-L-alanyl-D-glutamate--2,6-diaminopimelate ligase [Clostridiales bacterium]|nr:UDP-N-acetylmuramoyl-L-alanyl-D-glutamate--2,6-diaminopimelate ligase [Clostridiales bacterium]
MKLEQLVKNIDFEIKSGSLETEVKEVKYDSKAVEEGDLFVCVSGFQTDGHKYAKSAVEKGTSVIVAEHMADGMDKDGITVIITENTRKALALISAAYYDYPSEKMNVIGVTGTNGKTTTTYLIKTILDRLGYKTGVVGTIGNMIGDKKIHAERTTPESLELQELFSEMADDGVTHAIMEVSSHSLALDRVAGVKYSTAVFTNLTQDHLDFHKTMDNYMKAKGILFSMAEKSVINMDDEAGKYMKRVAAGKVLTTGIDHEDADLRAENISITAEGVNYTLDYEGKQYPVKLNIPGRFSIYNSLGAIGACLLNGISMDDIIEGLSINKGVAGRFQSIPNDLGITAIVDYAHTPDGLVNILDTAHEFAKGRIITVFGCGGDRDRTKRSLMAEAVGKRSDFAIITSDNPRTEDPKAIIDDTEVGIIPTKCPYHKIIDRREAINEAIRMAKKGDVVIVAGKGHEDYQIFADRTIHFDDAEEIKKACESIRR